MARDTALVAWSKSACVAMGGTTKQERRGQQPDSVHAPSSLTYLPIHHDEHKRCQGWSRSRLSLGLRSTTHELDLRARSITPCRPGLAYYSLTIPPITELECSPDLHHFNVLELNVTSAVLGCSWFVRWLLPNALKKLWKALPCEISYGNGV